MLGTIGAQVVGLTVFVNQRPSPFPAVFGYHEIFHVFVVIAGCFVYACNLSIIRRSAGLEPISAQDIYHFFHYLRLF